MVEWSERGNFRRKSVELRKLSCPIIVCLCVSVWFIVISSFHKHLNRRCTGIDRRSKTLTLLMCFRAILRVCLFVCACECILGGMGMGGGETAGGRSYDLAQTSI